MILYLVIVNPSKLYNLYRQLWLIPFPGKKKERLQHWLVVSKLTLVRENMKKCVSCVNCKSSVFTRSKSRRCGLAFWRGLVTYNLLDKSIFVKLLDFSGIFESNSWFLKEVKIFFFFFGKFMDRIAGALDKIDKNKKETNSSPQASSINVSRVALVNIYLKLSSKRTWR